MKKDINNLKNNFGLKFKKWISDYNYRLILFNIIIVFLFLLRSAGYFQPYFPISVNFIVIVGLVLSVVLLGAKSNLVFYATLLFWIFAAFLKIVGIDVWSERTGIYAYESLVFGVILFLFENIKNHKREERQKGEK
jgi:membrane-bound ClpP family serine protease